MSAFWLCLVQWLNLLHKHGHSLPASRSPRHHTPKTYHSSRAAVTVLAGIRPFTRGYCQCCHRNFSDDQHKLCNSWQDVLAHHACLLVTQSRELWLIMPCCGGQFAMRRAVCHSAEGPKFPFVCCCFSLHGCRLTVHSIARQQMWSTSLAAAQDCASSSCAPILPAPSLQHCLP